MAVDAAQGDSFALGALLHRVTPRLQVIAWNLCRDAQKAEDLCQEGLLKATDPRVLLRFQGWGSLDGYLIRCATRAMISALRTAGYRDREQAAPPEALEEMAGLDQGLGDAELSAPLLAAMAQLPERAQVIVLLLAVGDLTYAETAETVGVPIGTVRSTYARAREQLKRELIHSDLASTLDEAG